MTRYRAVSRLLLAACVTFALAGCLAEPGAVANALAAKASASVDVAVDATRPVEFTLGAKRFVLPANWFVDGIGPDFQGGVTLALHWPSLQPYPPGQPYSSFTTGPMRNQRVLITIDHIDRVPIDALPERYVTPITESDAENPSENIALRDRLPNRFGLEMYRTDLEDVALYEAREMQRPPKPPEFYLGADNDWFIARDADGRIRTVVKCDDSREPEGFEIRGETLVSILGATRWPLCGGHLFSMPEYSISVKASYSRPILRDWRRIEATVRDGLHAAHDRAQLPPSPGAPRP